VAALVDLVNLLVWVLRLQIVRLFGWAPEPAVRVRLRVFSAVRRQRLDALARCGIVWRGEWRVRPCWGCCAVVFLLVVWGEGSEV